MGARCCANATTARSSVQIRMCSILAESLAFCIPKEDPPEAGNGGVQDVRVHLECAGHLRDAKFVSTRKDKSAPMIRSDALMRDICAPIERNRTRSAERRIPATLRGSLLSDFLTTNGPGVVACSAESGRSGSGESGLWDDKNPATRSGNLRGIPNDNTKQRFGPQALKRISDWLLDNNEVSAPQWVVCRPERCFP
jgi:hypothetical protein